MASSSSLGLGSLKPLVSARLLNPPYHHYSRSIAPTSSRFPLKVSATNMAAAGPETKVIDSHLHIWASPQQAANKYPYVPGQEPTLPGDVDFLLQCMEEAGVDGALIVQPINHKFDHSLVTSVLKRYSTKFSGCCLANPAEDGSGLKLLEDLVLKDGYRAVRFNPYLWPSGEKVFAETASSMDVMSSYIWEAVHSIGGQGDVGGLVTCLLMTNDIGKSMFSKAGELRVPVGFMCMKGLDLHISEIEELCAQFPSTTVLLDHLAFCKPPTNAEERLTFSRLLKLSRFPQVYVKFSALFRVSRMQFPYTDLATLLAEVVKSFGANRVMWGSDFPFVVPECGYKGAKEAVSVICTQASISSTELEWIMGRTIRQLFNDQWS